jgi:4,5-dihydroxyphthalate decarboxylase
MTARRVELSIALSVNERTRPILEGRVGPKAVKLVPTALHPSEMFWRQLRFAEFDVSEMSMSSLLIATARGDKRWVALPIFTTRQFFHAGVLIRTDRGIERPADLKGKRIGVPEYQQTAAVWARGALEHEFGVRPAEIDWFMERGPDLSHGGATGFTPPDGVRLTYIAPQSSIGKMLAAGEIDGTLLYLNEPNLVDRSREDLGQLAKIAPLFPDPDAERKRYFEKTRIYPVNHIVVVRRELVERHTWLVLNLYSAFVEAKAEASRCGENYMEGYFQTGLIDRAVKPALAVDPLAYGVKANRVVLETLATYVHEQGLTPRRIELEELFAPNTLEL